MRRHKPGQFGAFRGEGQHELPKPLSLFIPVSQGWSERRPRRHWVAGLEVTRLSSSLPGELQGCALGGRCLHRSPSCWEKVPQDEPRQTPEGRKKGEGYGEADVRPTEANIRWQWRVPVTGEAHPQASQLGPDGEKAPSCRSEGYCQQAPGPLPPFPLSFPTCPSCHKSSL